MNAASRSGLSALDIQAMVNEQQQESRVLDFKRDIYGTDKNEMRLDVAAFANTIGGTIVIGIDESEGRAVNVFGIGDVDPDEEKLRLLSILNSGIEPRIAGLEINAIDVSEGRRVIVIQVPNSWQKPHLVKINEGFRLVGRTGSGRYNYDSQQVRLAFEQAGDLGEKIGRWRDDRINAILFGGSPFAPLEAPLIAVHVVSMPSFVSGVPLAPAEIKARASIFEPPYQDGGSRRFNLDGYLTYAASPDPSHCSSYCQVFRCGAVEGVSSRVSSVIEGRRMINAPALVREVLLAVTAYIRGLGEAGAPPPYVICVSLLDAIGLSLYHGSVDDFILENNRIDRQVARMSDVFVAGEGRGLRDDMRACFDSLWNACGFSGCPYYVADGSYSGPLGQNY